MRRKRFLKLLKISPIFRGVKQFLLERYSGAEAAYSLRKLSSTSTNAIRVRRSSDNSEQDIGFSGEDLDTTSLENFVKGIDDTTTKPADFGTGASAGYSLRNISDSYSGAVVRVRRSSDDAEQDIGFDGQDLDTTSLLSFVGAGNGFSYSEEFDNAIWDKDNSSVTSNQAEAPDGTTTADELIDNGTSAGHRVDQNYFSYTSGESYTISIYAKANTLDYLLIYDGATNTGKYFDLVNGNILGNQGNAPESASIENIGNGWYRCSITVMATNNNNSIIQFYTSPNGSSYSYSGSGQSIYLWGAQILPGTTIGGYVKTTGASNDDAFVTKWYDQSGNSNDATQSTAASQPQIVSSGTLVTENGKVALDFDGSDDSLNISVDIFSTSDSDRSIFSIISSRDKSSIQKAYLGFGDNSSSNDLKFDLSAVHAINQYGSYVRFEYGSINDYELTTYIFSGVNLSDIRFYLNGDMKSNTEISDAVLSTKYAVQRIGQSGAFPNSRRYYNGLLQEILMYPSDQSSNRTSIESNQADYYGITLDYTGYDGFVTTWYDQSGNGNNATQATASNQPQIVSDGSVITENGKAALDFTSNMFLGTDSIQLAAVDNGAWSTIAVTKQRGTNSMYVVSADNTSLTRLSQNIVGSPQNQRFQANAFDTNRNNTLDMSLSNENYVNNQVLVLSINSGFDIEVFVNNSTNGATSLSDNQTGDSNLGIASQDGIAGFSNTDLIIQEVIHYPSNQSSNRTAIETNINNHYQIY